jgi:3D (Asp-Asp-Asp) domain-containing protein
MNTNIFKKSSILRGTSRLTRSIFAGIILTVCLLGIITPHITDADFANTKNATFVAKATNDTKKVVKTTNVAKKVVKTINVVITAYSSTPDQTDDSPFITASGKTVADGIIANNLLPFGTKVRIPKLYGDKVFVVQDRMNRRMGNYRFDIWFPDRTSALKFGVKATDIEVLES